MEKRTNDHKYIVDELVEKLGGRVLYSGVNVVQESTGHESSYIVIDSGSKKVSVETVEDDYGVITDIFTKSDGKEKSISVPTEKAVDTALELIG